MRKEVRTLILDEAYEAPQLLDLGEATKFILGGDDGEYEDADHIHWYSLA
jgi:hypothetical protein